jgi:murein DD-endopeptidase MepM/ murein hydrolase activator NlpD
LAWLKYFLPVFGAPPKSTVETFVALRAGATALCAAFLWPEAGFLMADYWLAGLFCFRLCGVKMGFWVVLLMMGVVAPVLAAGNAYEDLENALQQAEAKLAEIRAKIDARREAHSSADRELRRSVENVVKLGQYPQGFWLARSLVMDAPAQADVVRVMGRQQAQRMAASRAEVGALTSLYGQANMQLEDLRQVQAVYADSRGKLMDVEQQVLRRAGLQAEALEAGMEDALKAPVGQVKVVAPVATQVSSGGLPVAGRVLRGFGSGEGAAKAGVVLRAPEGAPVKATQAAKVLFAGPFRHFGGLVIVKTVRGEDVLLGGMGTLHVNAGDDVQVGQQLGSVGEEGRIYWEVRRRGRVVNPL